MNERADGLHAVDEGLIETDFGEIDSELFLEEEHDFNGLHRFQDSSQLRRETRYTGASSKERYRQDLIRISSLFSQSVRIRSRIIRMAGSIEVSGYKWL